MAESPKKKARTEPTFIDPDFPHDKSSIGVSHSKFKISDDFDAWIPARNTVKDPSRAVLFDGTDATDLHQGHVGNCWMLSAISSIAEHTAFVKRLFMDKEISETGKYVIKLYNMSTQKWQEVTIDEFVPCKSKVPLFTRPKGQEIWVLLLEKAFAKFFTNYGNLSGGYAFNAYVALTGQDRCFNYMKNKNGKWDHRRFDREYLVSLHSNLHNPRTVHTKFLEAIDIDALWKELREHKEAGHISSASGAHGHGLVGGHYYGLLRVAEVTLKKGDKEKLVKMYNPWGHKEWTGDWGDVSKKWKENPNVAQQLGEEEKADDGSFWMSFTDFTNSYSSIQFCDQIMKDLGKVETIAGDWQKDTGDDYFVGLKIFSDGHYECNSGKVKDGVVYIIDDEKRTVKLKRNVSHANDHIFVVSEDGKHMDGHCPQSKRKWSLSKK